MIKLANELEAKFQNPLPGISSHNKMSHSSRAYYPKVNDDARKASVLILLYPNNGEWNIPLIERVSTNKKDRHSGQISLPGGQYEFEDLSMQNTAIREAEEEIGVEAQEIRILGELTQLYIPVSNFLVYPFVGIIHKKPSFKAQESEVNQIIETPLSILHDKNTIQSTDLRISKNIILKDVPYYNIQDHIVWGATAMMLSEFLEVMR